MVPRSDAEDTRDQILKKGGELLLTRGFNGFSYAHIAEALEIKPAAIHYHFPAKADLGVALVHRYRDRYRRWMHEATAMSPSRQLDGFFGIYEHFHKDGARICPGGALQAEFHAIPTEVQVALKEMVGEIHKWLAVVLEEGRNKREFNFTGDATDRATVVISALQGGLQLARTLGPDAFYATARQVRASLGA